MTDQAIVPWAFQVMVKPRGAICNLGCEYCYYLPKEEILRIMASLLRQGRAPSEVVHIMAASSPARQAMGAMI